MRLLLGFLPALACIGAMVLCMRMMSSHGKNAASADRDPHGASSPTDVGELRDEVNRLRAELRSRQEDPPQHVTP